MMKWIIAMSRSIGGRKNNLNITQLMKVRFRHVDLNDAQK